LRATLVILTSTEPTESYHVNILKVKEVRLQCRRLGKLDFHRWIYRRLSLGLEV
jgi:hypothetical protein